MEVVYTRRHGAIRAMSAESEHEHKVNLERDRRAQAEAELRDARETITGLRTRLAHAEMALNECKAELEAERAKPAVESEQVAEDAPVVEVVDPVRPKRTAGRPRKAVVEIEPQPVRWWPKGSKWDLMED